eukprot:TRINITY_DN25811_c0_g1_i1.p3 TRINITY_DN25811_c0_g1~~TRINITY_DN25811_c0_g1_i1.p3  ORF type:complete len:115 (-),score=4.40 TRINITY_DN25811_c0_g1_i1:124-468(-)
MRRDSKSGLSILNVLFLQVFNFLRVFVGKYLLSIKVFIFILKNNLNEKRQQKRVVYFKCQKNLNCFVFQQYPIQNISEDSLKFQKFTFDLCVYLCVEKIRVISYLKKQWGHKQR